MIYITYSSCLWKWGFMSETRALRHLFNTLSEANTRSRAEQHRISESSHSSHRTSHSPSAELEPWYQPRESNPRLRDRPAPRGVGGGCMRATYAGDTSNLRPAGHSRLG